MGEWNEFGGEVVLDLEAIRTAQQQRTTERAWGEGSQYDLITQQMCGWRAAERDVTVLLEYAERLLRRLASVNEGDSA